MGKYSRLGKNTLFVFIGNFGSKVIAFLMLPLYTKWLSVEDYGIVDMINVYVTLLLGVVTASIAESVFVFPKDQKMKIQKEYFSSGIFISFCFLSITGLIFIATKLLSGFFNFSNVFTNNIWFIYGLIISSFLLFYVQHFIKGLGKMKLYSSIGIVLTLSIAIFSFLLIPELGVYGYLIATMLAYSISALYSIVISKSYSYFLFSSIKKHRYIEMLKYSIPLIPNGLMWWFIGYFNRPLLEEYTSLEAIGLFAVANKFPTLIVMMFSVFLSSWQVSALEEFNKNHYREFYNKVLRILLFGLSFFSITLALSSKWLITLVVDQEFHKSWVYIPLLTIPPLLQAVSSFSTVNFAAVKKTKFVSYGSLIGAIVSVLSNFMLIPIFGLWGAIFSIIISYTFMALARVSFAWKYVKVDFLYKNIVTIGIPFLISLLITFYSDCLYKNLLILVLFFAFIFVNREFVIYLKNNDLKKIWRR